VVRVGQQGLGENVLNELEIALDHHELVKLRIPAADREEKRAIIQGLIEPTGAELIQQIGHVIVLFRKNPKSNRFLKQLKG
jgi:RNA-binding protein